MCVTRCQMKVDSTRRRRRFSKPRWSPLSRPSSCYRRSRRPLPPFLASKIPAKSTMSDFTFSGGDTTLPLRDANIPSIVANLSQPAAFNA